MSADPTTAAAVQSSTDPADTAHLRAGRYITLQESAEHLSGVAVLLDQLARALEVPDSPVELYEQIGAVSRLAADARQQAALFARAALITEGEVPLATTFANDGGAWGAAARGTDRPSYGGPAIVPSLAQLLHLATAAEQNSRFFKANPRPTTTYPEAMASVGRWESRAATERRERERAAAVEVEILLVECETPVCGAGEGEHCRTRTGRATEQPHTARRREAMARVDARIGYLGPNPVAVPDA